MFYRCPTCSELFAADSVPLARCTGCGAIVSVVPAEVKTQDAEPAADVALPETKTVPWETDGPSLRRFFATFGRLVRNAPRFFFDLEPETPSRPAERFAYLVSLIGLAGYFAVQAVVFAEDHGQLGVALAELTGEGRLAPSADAIARLFFYGLLASPILALFPMHIAAGLYHAGLFLVGAQNRGYDVTFRVAAYGLAPLIFLAIPGLGLLIAPGWILALHWIGLSAGHRISLLLSAMAIGIPSFFFMIFASSGVGQLLISYLGLG